MSGQSCRYQGGCWATTLASALDLGEVFVHCARAADILLSPDAPRAFGHEFIWQSYIRQVLDEPSEYCLSGLGVWRAKVSLICFYLVEWHTLERVIRQFCIWQDWPISIDTSLTLHKIDLRGKSNWDWVSHNARWLAIWEQRHFHLAEAPPIVENDCSEPTCRGTRPLRIDFIPDMKEYFTLFGQFWGSSKTICARIFRSSLDSSEISSIHLVGSIFVLSEVPHRLPLLLGV